MGGERVAVDRNSAAEDFLHDTYPDVAAGGGRRRRAGPARPRLRRGRRLRRQPGHGVVHHRARPPRRPARGRRDGLLLDADAGLPQGLADAGPRAREGPRADQRGRARDDDRALDPAVGHRLVAAPRGAARAGRRVDRHRPADGRPAAVEPRAAPRRGPAHRRAAEGTRRAPAPRDAAAHAGRARSAHRPDEPRRAHRGAAALAGAGGAPEVVGGRRLHRPRQVQGRQRLDGPRRRRRAAAPDRVAPAGLPARERPAGPAGRRRVHRRGRGAARRPAQRDRAHRQAADADEAPVPGRRPVARDGLLAPASRSSPATATRPSR